VNARRLAGAALLAGFALFAAALVVFGRGAAREEAAPETPRAVRPDSGSGRTPAEEAAVAALAAHGLRPATDEDAEESEGRDDLRSLYGDYRPYFVRGDLDGDGRLDFAQAFVRRDGPEPLFDVAVFFGTPEGFAPAIWVERGLPLSTGDLSIDRSVLVVTDDVEQDASRRFRWDAARGRFVDVDAGAGDGEEWTEPDGKLRTTA
jgi:hypothetical protein